MYLSMEEVIKRVKTCKRLTDVELDKEKGRFISAYDIDEGVTIKFNFLEFINYDNIFDFGSFNIDKEKFYKILKENLDPILFLIPRKIFFINSEEELNKLMELEEYEGHYMDINELVGINWCPDTIIVNVKLIKEVAKEQYEFFKDFLSLDEFYNEMMWTTLIHELRHMVCDNAVIIRNNEIPFDEGKEEVVECYCQYIFDEYIKTENFIVFK